MSTPRSAFAHRRRLDLARLADRSSGQRATSQTSPEPEVRTRRRSQQPASGNTKPVPHSSPGRFQLACGCVAGTVVAVVGGGVAGAARWVAPGVQPATSTSGTSSSPAARGRVAGRIVPPVCAPWYYAPDAALVPRAIRTSSLPLSPAVYVSFALERLSNHPPSLMSPAAASGPAGSGSRPRVAGRSGAGSGAPA
jgi:hypothetical protein